MDGTLCTLAAGDQIQTMNAGFKSDVPDIPDLPLIEALVDEPREPAVSGRTAQGNEDAYEGEDAM